uniref:Aquaporin 3b n=1 Tax=Echeneis naucrates TaxID=173247 RepID=A0A665V752_ECHNA
MGTFQIRHVLLRQALAECLGTLILVMFGCGSVAQLVLRRGSHGTFLTVNFAFGFAATLGIHVYGQVSGEDKHPSVVIRTWREPWRKFSLFFLFQTLGAFMGSAIIFGIHSGMCLTFSNPQALWDFGHGKSVTGPNATARIFSIGMAALIVCVLAIDDPHNNPIPAGLEAFTVGFVVLVICLSMSARDLGPRFFAALAGWRGHVFSVNTYRFLVPICAPFLGVVVGVLMYQPMIGHHLEGEAQERQTEEAVEVERFKLSDITADEDA